MAFYKKIVQEIRLITNINDSVDTEAAATRIRNGIPFRGVNAWILAFSVVIASVGLNINSVAVIIGAMLISPLIGPIFGIGLGLGTNDTDLLKKGLENLLVMVIISLLASFIYFLITPLNLANPTELDSRTSPTIYDVLIALFGGFAGIFEISCKEKGTVLSGVAIATALMPPLCTAGYGLANLNMHYFTGALFLFIINSVFIILATYIMVKYLGFKEAKFLDEKKARRTRHIITIITILVILPSIWSAFLMVRENNFKIDVDKFVENNRTFDGGYIYNYEVTKDKGHPKAVLYVSGEGLDAEKKNSLLASAGKFGISADKLTIREHNMFGTETNESETLMKGIYQRTDEELNRKEGQIQQLEKELNQIRNSEIPYEQVTREVKTQYPEIKELYLTRGEAVTTDSLGRNRCLLVVAKTSSPLPAARTRKLADWLKVRLNDSTVVVINK